MTISLIDEYLSWSPGSKIELADGQLIIGDSLVHSRLLLSQILRGWGIEAIAALAPEQLWWKAIAQTFDTPFDAPTAGDVLDADVVQRWAAQSPWEPEIPKHHGQWSWAYSQLRQTLRMAMFGLGMHGERLGQSLGGGFVNRLGSSGFMPDILFYRGQPRNNLYEYYLDGAAEIIVEFIQPGCENYLRETKRSHYQAAGVPELWLVDLAHKHIEMLRLVEGRYQPQKTNAIGAYQVSSIPGLTFFPDKLWLIEEERGYPPEDALFEIASDALRAERIPVIGQGVDWSRGALKLPVALEPVAISFDDYIYWCPEAKFEFVNGRPDIGGNEGIKGLAGMLMMTFGLTEVVNLACPADWVAGLLKLRAATNDPSHKASWWKIARETATLLRDCYNVDRIAVAGDLATATPLTLWSELVLVVWGLPPHDDRYTSPDYLIQQLSEQPRIRLIDGSMELTLTEEQLLQDGLVEL